MATQNYGSLEQSVAPGVPEEGKPSSTFILHILAALNDHSHITKHAKNYAFVK